MICIYMYVYIYEYVYWSDPHFHIFRKAFSLPFPIIGQYLETWRKIQIFFVYNENLNFLSIQMACFDVVQTSL